MPGNIVPIILLALLLLWVGASLAVQIRHRPHSTSGIDSLADLHGRVQESPYTLIQFFAPL